MPRGRFQRASRPAGQTGRGVAGSKCAGRLAKGPFCSGPVAASAAQAGPSGACLQAQGSAFLWAVHGRVQERTRDSSDSPQGPLHVLAVHRARPDLSEVRAGQPARPSGPLGLSDPSSLWPALPGGRSAAREAWTCVKLRETQAKSPRPGRNLLAENPAVGLPRAASAGRVPLCPPVGLCGHRHR